jgi:hypothetical protein
MKMKASMVVMSHLSDMQEEFYSSLNSIDDVPETANFLKYIIFVTGGDLRKEIDPDQLYKDFLKEFGKK